VLEVRSLFWGPSFNPNVLRAVFRSIKTAKFGELLTTYVLTPLTPGNCFLFDAVAMPSSK
jgi:hypothetical protein